MKRFLRTFHRWLGLLMALQIIAWMVSGLYFAWFPIETIRGEHLVNPPEKLVPGEFDDLVPVWVAWNNLTIELGDTIEVADVSLVSRDGKTWYRVSGTAQGEPFLRLVNGFTGQVAKQLNAEEAQRLALESLAVDGVIADVEWVTETTPGSEIRGRTLPLWKIRFESPEALNLYLHPWTGEVVTRRTTRWRVFDFLWMLHIMDFEDRDDFNTPLLQGAALLGLLIALSGVVYWALTTRLWRRRRQANQVSSAS